MDKTSKGNGDLWLSLVLEVESLVVHIDNLAPCLVPRVVDPAPLDEACLSGHKGNDVTILRQLTICRFREELNLHCSLNQDRGIVAWVGVGRLVVPGFPLFEERVEPFVPDERRRKGGWHKKGVGIEEGGM